MFVEVHGRGAASLLRPREQPQDTGTAALPAASAGRGLVAGFHPLREA